MTTILVVVPKKSLWDCREDSGEKKQLYVVGSCFSLHTHSNKISNLINKFLDGLKPPSRIPWKPRISQHQKSFSLGSAIGTGRGMIQSDFGRK